MKKIVILLFNVILLFSCTSVVKKHRTITRDSEGELILYVIGVEQRIESRVYYLNTRASAADTVLAIQNLYRFTRSTPFPEETYNFGDKLVLKKVNTKE